MKHSDVQSDLRKNANPEKAAFYPRFFKSGPGEYGYGDKFIGVTVPLTRKTIKPYHRLPLDEVLKLLHSEWHEERLAALLILVWQYAHGDDNERQAVYDTYLANTKYINNWDLVDSSAHRIVGPHLNDRPDRMKVLTRLAKSSSLWERRIAILSTLHYIQNGRADEALEIIDMLLHDSHDLIHKATGWMLREIGKRVDREILLDYLNRHAGEMPRTMLRYAIEHLSPEQKQRYMKPKESAK